MNFETVPVEILKIIKKYSTLHCGDCGKSLYEFFFNITLQCHGMCEGCNWKYRHKKIQCFNKKYEEITYCYNCFKKTIFHSYFIDPTDDVNNYYDCYINGNYYNSKVMNHINDFNYVNKK